MKKVIKGLPRIIVRQLTSFYLREVEGISKLSADNEDVYLEALKGFHSGEHRLIIPFRHVNKADGPVYTALFGRILPKKTGENLEYFWPRFFFGDMVLDWAGAGARWLFPRIGTIAVSNQRMVRDQIELLKNTITKDSQPVAVAPEAQVMYYNYQAGEITGGMTHFIKWCQKAKTPTVILPVTARYIFAKPEKIISDCTLHLKKQLGIIASNIDSLIQAVLEFVLHYLTHESPEGFIPSFSQNDNATQQSIESIKQIIMQQAMKNQKISDMGSLLPTVLGFRNVVFDTMHSLGISVKKMSKDIANNWKTPKVFKPLQQAYQHQQILDILVNFNPLYHRKQDGETDTQRIAEQMLYLSDFANRLRGGDIDTRYRPKKTHVHVQFQEALRIQPDEDAEAWKKHFLSID